jgi:hypothetical protein
MMPPTVSPSVPAAMASGSTNLFPPADVVRKPLNGMVSSLGIGMPKPSMAMSKNTPGYPSVPRKFLTKSRMWFSMPFISKAPDCRRLHPVNAKERLYNGG